MMANKIHLRKKMAKEYYGRAHEPYELKHYGVLGMKWGVRHYQDYGKGGYVPKDKGKYVGGDRTKEEQAIKVRNANKAGRTTDTNSKGYKMPDEWRRKDGSRHTYVIDKDTYMAEERYRPDGRAVYPPVAKVIRDFENDLGKNPYPCEKGFKDVFDNVNPNYGEEGTTNNCPFVGAAVEIRSRGYDIIARHSKGGACAEAFEHWFKGAETEMCDTIDELKNDILKDGDGSSGVMQGYYGRGLGSGDGGHTVHWRNENGNIIIADGQSHKEMNFDDAMTHYKFDAGKCFRTRLDNCEPDWDGLAEDGVIGLNRDKYNAKIVEGHFDPEKNSYTWQKDGIYNKW